MCVQVQRCEEFPYVSMAPSREPPQRLCQVSDVCIILEEEGSLGSL